MQLGTLQLGTDTDDAVLTDRLANVFASLYTNMPLDS